MAVDRSYVAQNDAQRERLRALVERLPDPDLARPLAAGWTLAGSLAHLALWDRRIVILVDQWTRAGASAVPAALDHDAVHWVNDAAKPLCLALPPRAAARLAVEAAEAADRSVAGLAEAFLAANAAAGSPVNLLRAQHRKEHLDEIERALGR